MADEQAQADVTATGGTQDQTTEVRQETPPAADPPAAPEAPAEPDRGDPRIAMMEERRKRQEYEALHNDPNWVYEQARKLGLAQDDTPSFAPAAPAPQQASVDVGSVDAIVAHRLDFERTIEKHPELDPKKGDKGLVTWAAALVDQGHKPSEAADIIFKTIEKRTSQATQEAVSERMTAQAQAESAKQAADLVSSTASDGSDAELEDLRRQAKNWKDPKAQEAAQLELLKRRMRA